MTAVLIVRSALLSLMALAMLVVFRKRSAAMRHALIVTTVLCMLAMPLLSRMLPARRLPVVPEPVMHRFAQIPSIMESTAPAQTLARGASHFQLPESEQIAFALWALGFALLAVRWLAAYADVVRRTRRARRTTLGVDVLAEAERTVPMTAWVGRHVILVPDSIHGWSEARIDHVLRHERAHVSRGDWFSQTLTRVACALFWPNPFVWVLARKIRDLAEEAADDRVLVSGVVPSHYATDLLDISREMRATNPAMALPMARKAEVARRIEMILNKRKVRGEVSLPTLLVGAVVLLAVSIPLASFALGPTRRGALFAALFHQSNPTSWAADVAQGLTTPATKSDDYVGALRDGRKVRVLQVAMKDHGTVVAWAPDGTPIPAKKIVKHWMTGKDREYRHILMEVETKAAPDDVNGGLGSGPSLPGEPTTLTFAGGGAFAGPTPGTVYIVSLIGVPKADGDAASFTFGLSDGTFHLQSDFDPASGNVAGDPLTNAKLEAAKPPFPWAKWKDKHPTPSVRFTAKMSPGIQSDLQIVAVLKNGKTENGDGNFGPGYGRDTKLALDYYFKAKPQQIQSIQIRKREAFNVEILDLHLKPNSAVAP